tara:strand:- start:2418 stop:2651 length:234 start_codon:yes stop_codon:yes gene_type:complete
MKAKKIPDKDRLKKLLNELSAKEETDPTDSAKRAEDILKLIKKRQVEIDIDEMLNEHAKLCAKVFLDKIFRAIINNK